MAFLRSLKASSWKTQSGYDVFLSFRGEDTRKNFTGHLYTALVNAGFHTFRDDPELERGENIQENLDKAIRQSRSSVIVFSKDYTGSRWCLDELVLILQLKRTSDHVVLPVFYDVNPSQLRKEGKALGAKYQESKFSDKIEGWQAAIGQVADLAGMVLENEANRDEAEFIKNVVREMHKKLDLVSLSDLQKELEEELQFIYPFVDEAEGKQLKSQTIVKPWLHKLRKAVYRAEDLLEDIKAELLRQEMEPESGSSSTSQARELISSPPSHAFDPAVIYNRAEEVLKKLNSIMERKRDVLGMEASAGYCVSPTPQSTSFPEDCVYGREEEKDIFINLLLSDNEIGKKISVIPIVGMGGIGKTTLAQFLYNDVRVEQHFEIQAWVCISEEFDVLRISQHICESLTEEACHLTNLAPVQKKLQTTLKGKRFFLVLDDIWNKNYDQWEILSRPFQDGAHGSKIVVTTRDVNVARMMGSLEDHNHLSKLAEEVGWSLFKSHALTNAFAGEHSHLEAIGREIVCKCKGLPLAIKSLGGLLRSKLIKEEWESVLKSDMWESPLENCNIMPSLWLSYRYLPPHLKQCFAYCSLFPKNYQFQKSKLVLLWKAQGFLQPNKNKLVEAIGEEYFNDLFSRSFFQHSSSSEHFVMHDLINDLANFVSGEFSVRWENSESPDIFTNTRHFSYMEKHGDSFVKLEAICQAKYLRTLLPVPEYASYLGSTFNAQKFQEVLCEVLPKLQYLRVLNLSLYDIYKLPDSIKNLKLLRHLNMSETPIKKLPDSICTMYNLQELLLRKCGNLAELPTNLGRLINLSHLDIEGTNLEKMPPDMGNLKELRILTKFVLDKYTDAIELRRLQDLRGTLRISGLQNVVDGNDLVANIVRDKKLVVELTLDWEYRFNLEDDEMVRHQEVLEKFQPHLNLERLRIALYGGKMFPGWSEYYFSSALVHLELVNCYNCSSLPPLGQLPSLTELHIFGLVGVVSIGREFYYGDGSTTRVNKPFRSLRSLSFRYMRGLQEWVFVGGNDNEGGVFPNLEKFWLAFCDRVKTIRLHAPKLRNLEIQCCHELTSFACKSMDAQSVQNLKQNPFFGRSLTSLELNCYPPQRVDWFLEEGWLPRSLTHLEIHRLSCQTIDGAKCFGRLSSLKTLLFGDCSDLWCLPDCGRLYSSLSRLDINQCPLLEKRCQRETGEDWPKIAHIPVIMINGQNDRQSLLTSQEKQSHTLLIRKSHLLCFALLIVLLLSIVYLIQV